jgi:adenine deaminase
MITINPARQLELDDRIGSIEPGKDADLVLFDKHPLSSFAKVQKVFIDGVEYFDRDRDLSERRERAKPRPQPAPESKPVAPELETAPAKPVPPPSENAKPQRGKP